MFILKPSVIYYNSMDLDSQIRDTRSILRHGKHIEELQKEKEYYYSVLQNLSTESGMLAEAVKVIKMSPFEQKRYFIQKKQKSIILYSIFGMGFYNLVICGVLDHSLKFYFALASFNILFLYISMAKYNEQINKEFTPLSFSEEEKKEIYQRCNEIGDGFNGEYCEALTEYEDICRKLKKLGVE